MLSRRVIEYAKELTKRNDWHYSSVDDIAGHRIVEGDIIAFTGDWRGHPVYVVKWEEKEDRETHFKVIGTVPFENGTVKYTHDILYPDKWYGLCKYVVIGHITTPRDLECLGFSFRRFMRNLCNYLANKSHSFKRGVCGDKTVLEKMLRKVARLFEIKGMTYPYEDNW